MRYVGDENVNLDVDEVYVGGDDDDDDDDDETIHKTMFHEHESTVLLQYLIYHQRNLWSDSLVCGVSCFSDDSTEDGWTMLEWLDWMMFLRFSEFPTNQSIYIAIQSIPKK